MKITLGSLVRILPGKRHGLYDSNLGIVRKPLDEIEDFSDVRPLSGWRRASIRENLLAFAFMVVLLALTVLGGVLFISSLITAKP